MNLEVMLSVMNQKKEDLERYLDIGIKRLKNVRFRTPLYFDTLIKRDQMLANIIKEYSEYMLKESNQEQSLMEKDKIKDNGKLIIKKYN